MPRVTSCTFLLPTSTVGLLEVCLNLSKSIGEALVVGRGGVNREEKGGESMNTFKTIPQFCRTTANLLVEQASYETLGNQALY